MVKGETLDVEKNFDLHPVQNQLVGDPAFAGDRLTDDVSHEWHPIAFQQSDYCGAFRGSAYPRYARVLFAG
jgi:hypothetical protein